MSFILRETWIFFFPSTGIEFKQDLHKKTQTNQTSFINNNSKETKQGRLLSNYSTINHLTGCLSELIAPLELFYYKNGFLNCKELLPSTASLKFLFGLNRSNKNVHFKQFVLCQNNNTWIKQVHSNNLFQTYPVENEFNQLTGRTSTCINQEKHKKWKV